MAVTGSPRLSRRLRTLFCAGSGTPSRYITASGRTAIMSTVRLIAKTKRLGVSIGSQTSAAPVSPDAQPPTRVAATAAATTERRMPAVIDLDTLSIINAKPGPPQALGMPGQKRGKSVAHAACTLKCIGNPRLVVRQLQFSLGQKPLANIKICLYLLAYGSPSHPPAGRGRRHKAAHSGVGGT